jgi:hypothetical protein
VTGKILVFCCARRLLQVALPPGILVESRIDLFTTYLR